MDRALKIDLDQELLKRLDAFSSNKGMAYFNALTKALCADAGADIAYVCLLTDNKQAMQTVSLYWDGKPKENMVYDLADTPCANLKHSDFCLYQAMVQTKFPKDQILIDEDIEAYLGIPVFHEDNEMMGAMVVLTRAPMSNSSDLFGFMQKAHPKVQTELRHYVAQGNLR